MKISQGKSKRPTAISTGDELAEESTHHGQSGKLLLAVFKVMSGIWLIVDSVVVALEKVQNLGLDGLVC